MEKLFVVGKEEGVESSSLLLVLPSYSPLLLAQMTAIVFLEQLLLQKMLFLNLEFSFGRSAAD